MKRIATQWLAAMTLLAASQVLQAADSAQPVKVYVDGLTSNVAEQVKKHAAMGETALRKYLDDTQKVHRLRYEDVTQPRVQPVSSTPGLQKEPKKHANEYR